MKTPNESEPKLVLIAKTDPRRILPAYSERTRPSSTVPSLKSVDVIRLV